MEAKNPVVSKAPVPIRMGFVALLFTTLGMVLFAMIADNYFPERMPDWWIQACSIILLTLFLSSCLLIERDLELALYGFAVVIFAILCSLLTPA